MQDWCVVTNVQGPNFVGMGSYITVAGEVCVLQVAVLAILVSFEQQNGLRLTWFYDSENKFI